MKNYWPHIIYIVNVLHHCYWCCISLAFTLIKMTMCNFRYLYTNCHPPFLTCPPSVRQPSSFYFHGQVTSVLFFFELCPCSLTLLGRRQRLRAKWGHGAWWHQCHYCTSWKWSASGISIALRPFRRKQLIQTIRTCLGTSPKLVGFVLFLTGIYYAVMDK